MPGPNPNPRYYPQYYGVPQRGPGSDGQNLAIPAPGTGTGVYPPGGAINPQTGMPYPINTLGSIVQAPQPMVPPFYVEPPLASQSLDIVQTNVLVPAGAAAAVSSGATQLANNYLFNLTGATCPVLTGNSTLVSYSAISPGVFRRFGVHVFSAMGMRAVRVQLQINGTNFPGLTEFELAHFFEGNEPAPVFIPFNKQDTISIIARNIDIQSAYLVTARLAGWRYSGA